MKKLVITLAIVVCVALSAVQALATPTPVSHWTMDDNADNAIVLDSSVYANDGTATRNTSELSTVGKIDGAFLFNGLSDSVEISDSGSLDFGTGSFTIAGWIKTSQIGEGQFIRFGGGSVRLQQK